MAPHMTGVYADRQHDTRLGTDPCCNGAIAAIVPIDVPIDTEMKQLITNSPDDCHIRRHDG